MLTASAPAMADDDPTLIVAGVRVGPITATTSEADLVQLLGASSVQAGDIEIGEGFTEPGTIIFPADAAKRAEIIWRDDKLRSGPVRVQINGAKSDWHFANGITLGTTLKELERLNGRPFTLTGFGWDYGGTVLSWEDGALAAVLAERGTVFLRLTPDYNKPGEFELEQKVLGDREIASSDPTMQAIDPTVVQIIVQF